jgi:predicted ArsR family transcriptional regulator
MDAVGFAPETVTETAGETRGEPTEVRLHHCPFLEVAEGNTDVVCAVHLGLMQGVLETSRSATEVDTLVPFASPGVCVARLRA